MFFSGENDGNRQGDGGFSAPAGGGFGGPSMGEQGRRDAVDRAAEAQRERLRQRAAFGESAGGHGAPQFSSPRRNDLGFGDSGFGASGQSGGGGEFGFGGGEPSRGSGLFADADNAGSGGLFGDASAREQQQRRDAGDAFDSKMAPPRGSPPAAARRAASTRRQARGSQPANDSEDAALALEAALHAREARQRQAVAAEEAHRPPALQEAPPAHLQPVAGAEERHRGVPARSASAEEDPAAPVPLRSTPTASTGRGFDEGAPAAGGGGAAGGAGSDAPADEGEGIAALDFKDMRAFVQNPIPRRAGVIQCYIERNRTGLANRLSPMYSLYLREGDRFVLAAKRRVGQKTSNYVMSIDKRDLGRRGPSFVGKVRSNWIGTEFTVYDDGASPAERRPAGALRRELAIANYASNVLSARGPRKMKVAIPRMLPEGLPAEFQPAKGDDTMFDQFKAGHTQNMTRLINKPPKWNDAVSAYVLNFNGRVTQASVKNFQLVTPEDQETVVLQFGRVDKDVFTMDLRWPISPLQAFGLCLTSFDYKLACE